MDPTAMPAFALPLRPGKLAPCVGCVMFGRTVGVEDTGIIALPGLELALVDVALIVDEVAAINEGVSFASIVPVSHSYPSTGRLP